jgi:cell division protein FtsW
MSSPARSSSTQRTVPMRAVPQGWSLASRLFGWPSQGDVPVRDWVRMQQPNRTSGIDMPLVWLTIMLTVLGLVMVYSASVTLSDNPRFARYTPEYFVIRHAITLGLGMVAALAVYQVPVAVWERVAPWFIGVSIVLLIIVLLPFVGKVVNGARRWIMLGPISMQPSEVAKLGIALYAASYMVRKIEVKEQFWRAVTPMFIVLGLIGMLLLAEPDMGAFMVIAAIALGVLFLGGVNGRMFFLAALVLVAAFVAMIAFSPWRAERIFAYLDPWNPAYAQGRAYQLVHSLIAFGRGGVVGQGLGMSIEKRHYLPEAHTDFLLAVIGEELGFIGVAVVVVSFFWLTRRLFHIGRQAVSLNQVFAGLLSQGIGIWIGGQAFINMGVNLGALPTKGLTLPLMSYGGSAIVMNLVALAIVLRVDSENRALMRGGRP